jgi:cyclic beta-1,2-glucan synthetase
MPRFFGGNSRHVSTAWNDTQSISSEIFGPERSRQHAHSLAESQAVTEQPPVVQSIISRLNDNAKWLLKAYREICGAIAEDKAVTPAAEWLVDNYHIIEEQIRQTRADLPPGFYRQLPKLADGPLAGHPRIFGLVWAYVAHTDSSFNPAALTDFVNEYQQVQPLDIGELWAVSISLRLILIENLRRISQRIVEARRGREAADKLADQVLDLGETESGLTRILAEVQSSVISKPFAVQLIQRLRDNTVLASQTLDWLEAKTNALGYSFDLAVSDEHHRQGAANVTVRNIVTSMRFVSDVNWEVWFDTVSLVDRLLRTNSNYGDMDFPSRTIYRTAIEELSRGSGSSELNVAQRALDHAIQNITSEDLALRDPGYCLIGPKRVEFEKSLGFKPAFLRRARATIRGFGLTGYLGSIAFFTVVVMTCGLWQLQKANIPIPFLVILTALSLLPVSEAGMAIVNFLLARIMDPAVLPGLAMRDGVPKEFRTLVAVPTLLTSRDDIEDLIERLEVHFLSNAHGDLYFALLTDWTDAVTERTLTDEVLLGEAVAGIERLNKRHDTDRFLLLHRSRKWNPQQNRWMGWERKRGKLHELNRLLRGAEDTSFIKIAGKLPAEVKFVITLDADTKLPRDAARRLVGKLAHPLNLPKFDIVTSRVAQGFGVLQPRVTPSLPVGHYGSLFQRLFSSSRGIDPYVFAVSDVYQDLFGEGSFAGKGIYDVDAFEAALAHRIPENTMLSHDLFEGIFARAALVTDIEVVEEFPESYAVSSARQHRWTRGDWQLLPWMIHWSSAGVPALGLWKMADNLRRSLAPAMALLSLFAAWIALPFMPAAYWTAFLVLINVIPPLLPAISGAIPNSLPLTVTSRIKSSLSDFGYVAALTAANLVFLAHQASVMVDAIFRTLYRLLVSRANLLEWTTAAQSAASHKPGITSSYDLMISSVAAGMLAIAAAAFRADGIWMIALPFAAAWFAAPAIALWMSNSPKLEDALASSPEDRKILRIVARRTWRFFEAFVTPGENMLPPDNFQEDPKAIVAHRTSPTNIGLYLLSIASAREFGWIGLTDAIEKIELTVATVKRMEKYRGHLFNWYDTTDLRPLEPKYISTVDSGNLAGHLIALANCCSCWTSVPADPATSLEGIKDILDILSEDLAQAPNDRRILRPLRKKFELQVSGLRRSMKKAAETPETVSMRLIDFAIQATNIHATATALADQNDAPGAAQLLLWANTLRETVESHFKDASAQHEYFKRRLDLLVKDLHDLALGMEFGFLLDPQRMLLSIGYRVAESMRDESCYDMLASEARLASFFAIAKGDLRTRHWFRLGRTVTAVKGGAALISWSGSMFEYLMPSLVMRAPSAGLLDQTTRLVVQRQISYAKSLGIPWGISESAFNARDVEFTYQYSNFGVPGLGLKRGLAGNTVIAPYATGLAAMVAPRSAAKNFQMLARAGGVGAYGFYEALDYTPERLPKGDAVAVVKAYFAHHQGMTIVAILNAVNNGEMRERFHAEPMVRATELLLQERAPRDVPVSHARAEESNVGATVRDEVLPSSRIFSSPGSGSPATHLLSNGQYSVMLTVAGGGYSTCNGQAITRWREDGVCDEWGSFIYLREPKSNKIWSAGHMPVALGADGYAVAFAEDKAEFIRSDGNFITSLECLVSPEHNVEARRVTVSNAGLTSRDVELTSYAELVLAPASADVSHPAFSKMFVVTEYVEELETLLATRRRRSPGDPEMWVAQFMVVAGTAAGSLEFETDRARFLGSGNTTRMPAAMANEGPLSNTVGTVLDPAFVLRRRMRIAAGRKARFTLWTLTTNSREAALDLVDRHRHKAAYDRAAMLAWTQAQIQLRHLSITADEANLYQSLASHLIYANQALRASAKILLQDMGPQSALWPQGISGDRPILLVRIDDVEYIELIHQLLKAFSYWKTKSLAVDLVILNDRMSSYVQDLQGAIEALVRKTNVSGDLGKVFMLRADLLSQETLRVLPAVARVVLYSRRGDLASQLSRVREVTPARDQISETPRLSTRPKSDAMGTQSLEFFNGFGGFDANGREYVTILSAERPTPAPWINVIANPNFGFQCSADGGGYAWFGNSRENQITAWSNDPLGGKPSEAIYVRDENDGLVLSPTLQPLNSTEGTHVARHGFGYSVFERDARKLRMELLQFTPLADSIKISRLKLINDAAMARTLSVTFYAEWILGTTRAATAPFLTTTMDELTGAMFARNPWNMQAQGQVAFADISGHQTGWTGDRREFLGAYGSIARPRAIFSGSPLSKRTSAGLDPCCALQTSITLAPGETRELIITLGAANNVDQAQAMIAHYRNGNLDDSLDEVKRYWTETLDAVQVKTPDRSLDVMMNGWLLYQTLACRMWARSGFYQASGAYGFRDQLQDSMALLTARPAIAREHIIRAGSRQFVEGDFQHWWLPSTGMGVRTRISDDTVWLANCVGNYIKATGDGSILDEEVSFLEGQSLLPGEHDAFFLPSHSDEAASLYEHCAKALDISLKQGVHGLPLIGTGDWNDGMNRVGEGGQGESVWLGWFLLSTLKSFAPIAERRGDAARLAKWRERIDALQIALERDGWDGRWYRRGFFDDGSLLGSSQNEECRIDAIAQSWAVLSGGAAPERAVAAMEECYQQLVRPKDKLALLFTPPFDKTEKDPGYIKAYPPGVRENGGQYTHGVIWSIFAHAELGQAERASELFGMINPINHARTEREAMSYRVEPYVMAADVYSVAPHVGRGGWTWYTGSAGWMYRAGLEAILGITREGNKLRIKPCVPDSWDEFEVIMQFDGSRYEIKMTRTDVSPGQLQPYVKVLSPYEFLISLQDKGSTVKIELPLASVMGKPKKMRTN